MSENVNLYTGKNEEGKPVAKGKYSDFKHITRDVLVGLRDGDYKAYDIIYLRCFEPMQAFLRLLLHSATDAEELCQELFMKLWENRERIDPDSNFRSYLYTMAKTTALKYLEHKNVVYKYVNFRMKEFPEFEHSADEQLISNELSLILKIALANMPAQRRRVFEMSRFEGLSNDEIAEKLNISSTTVRAHLHNALKTLKELMTLVMVLFIAQ